MPQIRHLVTIPDDEGNETTHVTYTETPFFEGELSPDVENELCRILHEEWVSENVTTDWHLLYHTHR